MPKTLRFALASVLAAAMAGCASAPTQPTGVHTFAGGSGLGSSNGGGLIGNDAGSLIGNGSTSAPATTAPTASASTAPTKPSTGSTNPAAGIGLGTFFDTYNFNFPIPAGQALGTVANASQKLLGAQGGHVYLQIGMQTVDKAPTTRQPLNVSFVFDHSGSMYGDKIDYTRVAAEHFIDELGAQDLFSLIAFDSQVATTIAPAFAVDKEAMKLKVEGLEPGSATNIDGGLDAGYRAVRSNYNPNTINRVVLMTDGEANVGITDPETLAQRAAAQAADGVTTSTIGVGLDFNQDFLKQVADAGKGSFYYANSREAALNAFVGEVQALQRIVAKGVKLDIELADGVKLVQVYGHTAKTAGQSLNVDSNDLITGQSKVILLELDVPPGTAGMDQALATVAVDFDDVPFGGHKTARAVASVTYSDDAAAIKAGTDGKVASSVIVLQAASQLLRVADLLSNGQAQQAKDELANQYEIVGTKATELADDDLKNEAADIKQYLDRIGKEDADALAKEIQFDAVQQQQGKKKVVKT
jgi:Ca-activated chloride channel family protein